MKIYVVKKGDTLYFISQKHNVSIEEILKLNPAITNPDVLDVGMKLKIPSTSGGGVGDIMHQHVVKQGDTLWKLSKAWGVPLADMIKANPQLKNPNVLLTGEIVNIPKSTHTSVDLQAAGTGSGHHPLHPMSIVQGVQNLVGGKKNTAPIQGKTPTAPIMPVPLPAPVPAPAPVSPAGKAPTGPIVEKKPTAPIVEQKPVAPVVEQKPVAPTKTAPAKTAPAKAAKEQANAVKPQKALPIEKKKTSPIHAENVPNAVNPFQQFNMPAIEASSPANNVSPAFGSGYGYGNVSPLQSGYGYGGGQVMPLAENANLTPLNVGGANVAPFGFGPSNVAASNIGPLGNVSPANIGPSNIGPSNVSPFQEMPYGGYGYGYGPTGVSPSNIGPESTGGYGYGYGPTGVSPSNVGPESIGGYGYGFGPTGVSPSNVGPESVGGYGYGYGYGPTGVSPSNIGPESVGGYGYGYGYDFGPTAVSPANAGPEHIAGLQENNISPSNIGPESVGGYGAVSPAGSYGYPVWGFPPFPPFPPYPTWPGQVAGVNEKPCGCKEKREDEIDKGKSEVVKNSKTQRKPGKKAVIRTVASPLRNDKRGSKPWIKR
ncbi:LysM peptidoglycan-binding domain-containing protein [Paenibacillus sp. NEAU-GSW1]|uniref:LysM peptidoglycan-binding domain-containing protein n=1 Tax=Paenibacillus sp. NEAU-GSW1 TaxID=2682486 RepID=UPI00156526B1